MGRDLLTFGKLIVVSDTDEVSQSSHHDVVIIGAGFIGVATAQWLQMHGHKVTLVDEDPFKEGAYYGNAYSTY